MPDKQRPPRVVVTSPRTRAARRGSYPVRHDIDEQTALGEVYMRSLIRAQLRLALLVLAALVSFLGGLPLLFAIVPELRDVRLFGVDLPWLILGFAVYPLLVGAGWFYVRQAERTERDFADLVERP